MGVSIQTALFQEPSVKNRYGCGIYRTAVHSSVPRQVQDSAQLEIININSISKQRDSGRMHTFPVGNSLVPHSDLMLPSPTIVVDECISENLSRDAIRTHHLGRGGFQ